MCDVKRVLLVTNNKDWREELEQLLAKAATRLQLALEVLSPQNLDDARSIIEEQPINLVVWCDADNTSAMLILINKTWRAKPHLEMLAASNDDEARSMQKRNGCVAELDPNQSPALIAIRLIAGLYPSVKLDLKPQEP